MPYPKGIKSPEIRAVWLAERRAKIAAFDEQVAAGLPRYKAALAVGSDISSIEAMRRSIEHLEEAGQAIGRAGSSYIDLGLSLLTCLRRPGETLTSHDIAAWCGCSRAAIQRIEERALQKVKRRLIEVAAQEELVEELREILGRGAALV